MKIDDYSKYNKGKLEAHKECTEITVLFKHLMSEDDDGLRKSEFRICLHTSNCISSCILIYIITFDWMVSKSF